MLLLYQLFLNNGPARRNVMIKLIGENINIISKSLGPAIRERRNAPILDIAKQMEYMDYIDLNIGPSKKDGVEVIEWLIKEVRSVSSKKLSIDTTNPEAMYAALCLLQDQSPLINSISLQPERLEEILPAAAESGADVIGLLWGENGMPRDINERCMLAVELLLKTTGELPFISSLTLLQETAGQFPYRM